MAYLKGRLDALRPTREVAASISVSRPDHKTLAANAVAFAKQMRDFELQQRAEQEVITDKFLKQHAITWDQMTTEEIQHSYRRAALFRNNYLGKATYFRDELEKRLNTPPLSAEGRWKLLAFDGALAGPSPISDAADYIEKLARQLSPP